MRLQVVLLLEREFEMLETAYKQRGANPIYAWFSLSLGVLSAILTIAWIMQIIIAVLFPAITGGNAVFLDGLLKIMSKAHVLGPDLLVYSLLCGYLVIVSLHGNIRINFRVIFNLTDYSLLVAELLTNATFEETGHSFERASVPYCFVPIKYYVYCSAFLRKLCSDYRKYNHTGSLSSMGRTYRSRSPLHSPKKIY